VRFIDPMLPNVVEWSSGAALAKDAEAFGRLLARNA